MGPHRIPTLALAADVVAVVVFAAIGRASHDESASALGLIATAAPFVVGLGAAWATPVVRAHPTAFRPGVVVVGCTAVLGLLIRYAFTGRLPWTFALVATASLAVLMLGWRGLAALVAHRAGQRVR